VGALGKGPAEHWGPGPQRWTHEREEGRSNEPENMVPPGEEGRTYGEDVGKAVLPSTKGAHSRRGTRVATMEEFIEDNFTVQVWGLGMAYNAGCEVGGD